jgi:hypothetical protein
MVIDGQQRLATTQIFLSSIKMAYQKINHTNSSQIDDLLRTQGVYDSDRNPTLLLQENEQRFFRNHVTNSNREEIQAESASENNLKDAIVFFDKKVDQLHDEHNQEDFQKIIQEFHNFIINYAAVLVVTCEEHKLAFKIFRSLNARGKNLTAVDLVKNQVFASVDEGDLETTELWTEAFEKIESVDSDQSINFLRHYWNSQYSLIRESEIPDKVEAMINTAEIAKEFTRRLHVSSDLYAALINPSDMYWLNFCEKTHGAIKALVEHFKVVQIRPLLLICMEKFGPSELSVLLRSFECWTLRGLTLKRWSKGAMEAAVERTCKIVREAPVEDLTAGKVAESLDAMIPTDAEFEQALSVKSFTSKDAHYILNRVEVYYHQQINPDSEYQITSNRQRVHVEHIFPKSASNEDWPIFFQEGVDRKKVLSGLGNLTLLSGRPNRIISNKSFSIKRDTYLESDTKITKKIAEYDDWTPQNIEARGLELSKLVVGLWPRTIRD